ncbi:MAG: hypothetical protein LBR17_02510 [Bacteroidales bacterium]|jgi:hypothetical protein|nr:hypothetical protein [Bacteroidales bacterium]
MKKTFLIIATFSLCMVAFTGKTMAQKTFKKGTKVVNVGIGLGSTLGGYGYSTSVPPISVSLDWGIIDNLFNVDKLSLGVGGYLGYSANKWVETYGSYEWGYKYSYIIPGARGTIHYEIMDKFEGYGGLMLGYNIVSGKEIGDWNYYYGNYNHTDSYVQFSAFVGARYYFADAFGAWAELGYGIAYFNLGLSLKF